MAQKIITIGDWNDETPAAPIGSDNIQFAVNRSGTIPQISGSIKRATPDDYGTVILDANGNPNRYLGGDGDWHDISEDNHGVPSGGNANQILSKVSSDDYDIEWRDEFINNSLSNPFDDVPSSPNAMDDEFSGSSLDGKWTQSNSPSGIVVANNRLKWTQPAQSSKNIRSIIQPVSGSSWTFFTKFTQCLLSSVSWSRVALSLYNSGNGRWLLFGPCNYNTDYPQHVISTRYSNLTTVNLDFSFTNIPYYNTFGKIVTTYEGIYFYITLAAGVITFGYSWNGTVLYPLVIENVSSYITAITDIGISIDQINNQGQYLEVEFFRKTA
jgi:hypothetical protein